MTIHIFCLNSSSSLSTPKRIQLISGFTRRWEFISLITNPASEPLHQTHTDNTQCNILMFTKPNNGALYPDPGPSKKLLLPKYILIIYEHALRLSRYNLIAFSKIWKYPLTHSLTHPPTGITARRWYRIKKSRLVIFHRFSALVSLKCLSGLVQVQCVWELLLVKWPQYYSPV